MDGHSVFWKPFWLLQLVARGGCWHLMGRGLSVAKHSVTLRIVPTAMNYPNKMTVTWRRLNPYCSSFFSSLIPFLSFPLPCMSLPLSLQSCSYSLCFCFLQTLEDAVSFTYKEIDTREFKNKNPQTSTCIFSDMRNLGSPSFCMENSSLGLRKDDVGTTFERVGCSALFPQPLSPCFSSLHSSP